MQGDSESNCISGVWKRKYDRIGGGCYGHRLFFILVIILVKRKFCTLKISTLFRILYLYNYIKINQRKNESEVRKMTYQEILDFISEHQEEYQAWLAMQ